MATWSPDNVILTEIGQQILSKVQAGVGAITVTRIVTGGTIIPYAQLYKATSIPDIKQECTILSVSTDMKGSEISVSVSNEDLEESYSLYTLGIYVTHPDFEGEQLYFVAECNTDNPDVIPLPSVTIATMYYSLYMVHENTSNVTINVSTAGSVTIDMINKPGGVAGLDSSGKIYSSQLPDMDLDYVPNSDRGVPNGVATLDDEGKVLETQLPPMDYEPSGSVDSHNKSPDAHSSLFSGVKSLVNDLEVRVSLIEGFLYSDITTNPHSMSLFDLSGLTVTGYWNKASGTLEC